MLIRSQCRKRIVVLENCDTFGIENCERSKCVSIYAYNGNDESGVLLGIYSNAAKGEKVMDMIQEVYSLSLYCDHAFDCAANVQRPYIFAENRVFQMPEDSEV